MKTLKETKLEKLQYLKNHGDVRVSAAELEAKAGQLARIAYRILKDAEAARRAERKAYKDAAALVGRERLDAGIALVKSFEGKTYYFIDNVMLFKASHSDNVTIETVSDEFRREFVWEEWYAAPFAAAMGMTPEDKNLSIC